jgi:hypothetical protein
MIMNQTKFGVFYETETIGSGGFPVWTALFFGFETRRDAELLFELLQKATNHESRMVRGFRNLRLCEKHDGVWQGVLV